MGLTIRVERGSTHQRIDGFGFCQAFQRASWLRGAHGLPAHRTREILDLLFDTERGAGFSILRLGIGSGAGGDGQMRSIAATAPDGPDQPLRYDWDGDDSGQVWLAQQAVRYGVRRFYATAWSAPGYMLHNGTDIGDGVVRGMPGTSPSLGDWRAAYAEYLLQYVRFYRECGVEITDLGFVNEPDLLFNEPDKVMTYPQMRLDPAQVVDFIKVIGPAIERSGLPLTLVACDAMMWTRQEEYTAAIEADPDAARWVGVHAGHNYVHPARRPLPTARPTWMSEWDPDVDNHTGPWTAAWDSGHRADGIRLAEDVHDALTMADIAGYLYWFGTSTGGTRALVQLDGADYQVSGRLWALATYSRFIRPGALRLGVSTSAATDTTKVSAFRNPDGSTVLAALNLATTGTDATVELTAPPGAAVVQRWLTDAEHPLSLMAAEPLDNAGARVSLPARSLTAVVVRGG